jgi:CBS domain-containing protein
VAGPVRGLVRRTRRPRPLRDQHLLRLPCRRRDPRVDALDETVRAHRHDGVFLARLASGAGTSRVPIGLFHRVRSTADGAVDVKAGGINPIVALARVLAVEAGTTARSTTERLSVAAAQGTLGQDAAEELTEAFRFFQGLRIDHHLEA